MGLQVIQAKRLVEQEKMSSNAFHQGVQSLSDQSLSDPFASKLAHLLCFNFDELYDIHGAPYDVDSLAGLCSDPQLDPWQRLGDRAVKAWAMFRVGRCHHACADEISWGCSIRERFVEGGQQSESHLE